ncbi:MAG: hypothetical protein HY868_14750 [Chloroflexi bacterium]|nr:hypothetical protein [Chloroflexota bacterium]
MDNSGLAPWRDLSIVWFVFWTFIVMLIPGAAFFYAVRGMRWLNRHVHLGLLHGQIWALRIQRGAQRASDSVAEVPIRMHSNAARARVTLRGILDYVRGEE